MGIGLGLVLGALLLNVVLPRLSVGLGLEKRQPPVPFVINGDL